MTNAQLTTLKTDIQARPNLWTNGKPLLADADIAAFYNTLSAVNIWRPSVTVRELNSAIAWAAMVAITQEKQLTYQSMIWANEIDMTDNQVRNGVTAVFGAGSTSETGIMAVGKRVATFLEALFSGGAGTTKVSTLFGVQLQSQDVTDALSR